VPHQRYQFLDIERWIAPMKHRMAVRTNRHKVLRGVNHISGAELGDGHNMMDVNEIAPSFAVCAEEIEIADETRRSTNRDA
jgi:hypothetical protein